MEHDLNSVKIDRQYHHGALKHALIDSALAVLADKGVEQFSLREVARRAGVSPAAYKHHFASTRALLTELAVIAFTKLADTLATADSDAARNGGQQDRRGRLIAQGTGYVRFALAEPQLFDLMWRSTLLDMSDPALAAQKSRAFDCLDHLLRGNAAPTLPHLDPHMAPTLASWSIVHGFARLALDGGLGESNGGVESGVETVMAAMLGLLSLERAPND